VSRGSRRIAVPLSIVCLLALSACGMPVYDEQVVARYRLFAPDTREQTCLLWNFRDHSGPCLIQETVFGVGFNDKYVVVESHPNADRAVTAFWYLVRDKRTEANPIGDGHVQINGPFSKTQYTSIRERRHLPEFRTILTDLE
jgi:hypothetical protein